MITKVFLTAAMLLTANGFVQSTSHPWLHLASSQSEVVPISVHELTPAAELLTDLESEGYPYAELSTRIDLEIAVDGSLSERVTKVRYFLNSEGIQSAGTITLSARSQVEELFIEEAYIHFPDGSIRHLDLGSIQVSAVYAPNVFSDVHTVALPFEGLIPGSSVVVRSTTVQKTHEWPLPWSEIYYLQGTAPIISYEVNLSWDADLPTPSYVTDAEHLTCIEIDSRHVRCSQEEILPADYEPEMSSWVETIPQLVISIPHGWSDIANAELELIRESLSRGSILTKAEKLLEGAAHDRERLRRIHRFVADEVRYVALEHGKAAIAPAAAAQTLRRLYGDCKGKVALFLALAREAGLKAYPVLVATDRISPSKLIAPSWRYFNHMIGCAELRKPPEKICMDFTTPYTNTGDLPAGLYGAVSYALNGKDDGPTSIESPEFIWDIKIRTENEVKCDGSIDEVLTRSFTGTSASELRSILRGMTKEEREEWAIVEYRSVMGQDHEPTIEFLGIDEVHEPVTITTKTSFAIEALLKSDEYEEPDTWLVHYASWFDTSNEKHSFSLNGAVIQSKVHYSICIDGTVQFVGAGLDMKGDFGTLKRDYTRAPHDVHVNTHLKLPNREIGAGDLDRYRRFLRTVLAQTYIWFRTKAGTRS